MTAPQTVWVDFENAPQVWVLSPIIRHLRKRGYRVVLTARDFSYTVTLARSLGLDVDVVGFPGFGKTGIAKTARALERALRLYGRMSGTEGGVDMALSHGSRAQIIAAHYRGIPVVTMLDYEFVNKALVRFIDRVLVPAPIPKRVFGRHAGRVEQYPGLKEDLYLWGFRPGPDPFAAAADPRAIRVLLRPEGRFTHYRSSLSEILQRATLERLAESPHAFVALLPRDEAQGRALGEWCERRALAHWIPDSVLSGPELIAHADVVLGGGGTMTREAAVLGVPSYSFFGARWGAVDRHLVEAGRLRKIASVADARNIAIEKRGPTQSSASPRALEFITELMDERLRR